MPEFVTIIPKVGHPEDFWDLRNISCTLFDCVNFENAPEMITPTGKVRLKHAIRSQNAFQQIVRRAEAKGMQVNTKKTGMVCILDSLNYKTAAYIEDRDGVWVESGDKLKILGCHFSDCSNVGAYVDALKKRFGERYWVLRHLRRNGFSEEDLLKVYTSMVRPVAGCMQEVYHSMLTDPQDESIKRLQSHALRCIYGSSISARRLRDLSGLTTLRERRIQQCNKFAHKCADSDRFEHWFPHREGGRATRAREEFVEEFARCDCLYNSPIYYMRRRLDGKPGKVYGSRNSEYRV